MSFEGIFTGKTTTKKALPTVQSKSSFSGIFSKQEAIPQVTKPQEFVGPLPKNGILTKSLPEHLGGGEYKVDPLNIGKPVKSIRAYADLPTKEKEERDHIISVALGGTSDKNNLQYLATTDEGRQEGKVSVEQEAINSYLRGDIDLPQARAKIAQKQQQIKGLSPTPEEQTVRGQFIPGVKQVFSDIGSKFKGLFSKEEKPTAQTKQGFVGQLPQQEIIDAKKELENEEIPSNIVDKLKEIKDKPSQLVPFLAGGVEVKEMAGLLASANRLNKGTETDEDLKKLNEYIQKADKDTTFGYKVLDVIAQLPSFAGEIYLTGGVAGATRLSATKTLKKILTKEGKDVVANKLKQKGIGLTAGLIARTAQAPIAGATRIPAGTLEKQVSEKLKESATGEDSEPIGMSIAKATGEQWAEVISEFSGGAIGKTFEKLSDPVKDKLLKTALFSAFKKANPGKSLTQFQKIIKEMGWNGTINEMAEERVADILQGTLEKVGLSDQEFKLPSKEQLAVELISFSIPGVAISAINKVNERLAVPKAKDDFVGPQAPKLKMDETMPELPELPEKTVLSKKLKKLQGQFIDGGIMDEDGDFQEEEYDEELETEIIKELEDKGFDYEVGDLDNYIFVKIADKNISKVEASKKYKDLLEEVHGKEKTKLETDKEGNIIAYHGTTAKNAKKIMSGEFDSGDFSPSPDTEFLGVGGAGIYGDKIIKVKLDPRKIEMRTVGEIKANNDAIISKEIYNEEEEDFREVEVNKQKIKIAKQDLYEMADFTDFVNGTLKLSEDKVKILQGYADKIAEKYGFEQTASDRVLANQFGKALDQVDDEFVRKPKEKFKLEEKTLENKKYTKALKYLERANPSNKISDTRGFLSPNGNIIDLGAFGQHPLALAEAGLSGKDVDSFTEFGVIRLRNTGEGGQQNIQISQKPTAKQIEQLELLSTKIPIYFDLKNGEETLSSPESGVRRDDFIRIVKDFFGAKQKQTEDEKNLMVVHNLSEANYNKAKQIGGIPNPSIAVIDPEKGSLEGFGEISLIASKDLIDPKKSKKVSTFGADVYSPRFPSTSTIIKSKGQTELIKRLGRFQEVTHSSIQSMDFNDFYREAENNEIVMASYLAGQSYDLETILEGVETSYQARRKLREVLDDNNLRIDFSNYVQNLGKDIGVEEKIFKGFTNTGNRQYLDLTAENASKLMNKEKGEGFNYGLGSIRAKIAPKFDSMKKIKENQDKIVSSKDFEELKKSYEAKFFELLEEIGDYDTIIDSNQFVAADRASEALGDYMSGEDVSFFKQKFKDIPKKLMDKIELFKSSLKEMPTEYFESKFKRVVQTSEFQYAVVPNETSETTIKELEKDGLIIVKYDSKKEGDRNEKIKALKSKIAFKKSEASLDKQVKEITIEEAKKQLAKIFNNNEVEFLAMKKLPNRVEGRYVQAMIQVLENDGKVKDLVVFHEAFHAYMDIFPSSAEKAKIFDIVKINFKDEVSAKKELYKQGGVNLNDSDASEEVLADKFALYLRDSGKIKQPELKSFFQKLIEQIKKWITGINEVENLFKQITEGKTEKQGVIPKTSKQKLKFEKNSLEEEAKKYKSVNEFLESIKTSDETLYNINGEFKGKKPNYVKVFHGTSNKAAESIKKEGFKIMDKQRFGRYTGDGIYFSPEKFGRYSENGSEIEAFIDISNYKDVYLPEGNIDWQPGSEIVNNWKKKYDGVIIRIRDTDTETGIVDADFVNEIVAYNPETVYTKPQLTEIWNKANNKKIKYKFEEPPYLETIEDTREIPKEETDEQKRRSEVTRKLQAQMDAIQKELEKVQLEELKYTLPDEKFLGINDELEGQYQNFKEIMKLKSAKAISETEDVTQLKKDLIGRSLVTVISKVQRDDKIRKTPSGKPVFDKNGKMLVGNIIRDKDGKPVVTKTKIVKKITPEQIDNILYNQEESEEVIFEMFKDRILEERSNRGWKGKLADDRKQLSKKMARVEKAMKEEERRGEVFAKGQLAGFERGVKEGADQAHNLINKRRYMIRITRDFFNLTDNDIKNLAKKDLRYMTDAEFTKFLDDISVRAMELNARRELKSALLGHIEEYELKNTENLQKALKLPPIEKMTIEQLEQFHNAILPFEFGDEFLSVRKLETLDNTELAGMRTVREIRSNLLKKLNLDEDILDEDVAKVSFGDRFKYDTALAEKSPFYNLMVQEVLKSELLAEQVYLNVEERTQELTKKARDSRRKIKGLPVAVKIGNALIPQDKLVFNWLSATADKKLELQAEMTKEEMDLALYVQAQYAKMRDMLIKKKTLERYRENYITHTQRSFLEAWKDSGITRALKEIIIQNRRQEAYFDIIDDTGQILPLEKFFQFSLRRIPEEEKKRMRAQGIEIGVDPTKNVAKAFLTYFRTFAKKSQLDSIIPMLDSYVFVLQDRARKTPRGIELDKGLKNFFNDWMNTKKGRVKKLYVLDQGTKLDTAVRAGNALVTLIDLGINIPVGLASNVGETAMNFVSLGTKKMALGVRRKYTKKGKSILKKYENFIGKGAFAELDEVSKDIGDKLLEGVYLLFKIANVRANKTFLLGSMTKEEWASGEISPERLAQMKIDMGRYRAVSGSESIIGKTSLGKTFTKYKTWAVPALTTSSKNIKKMLVLIKNGKNPLATREFQELFRSTIPVLVIWALLSASDDDDSFTGQLFVKIRRELLSSISALSPKMWLSTPRLQSFLSDLGNGIEQLILLEKYKEKEREGQLKGFSTLKTTFKPQLLKQIKKATTKEDSDFDVELPDLPEMPELPDLPELPEL